MLVSYHMSTKEILNERFINVKPENMLVSAYCKYAQSPRLYLVASVNVVGIVNNTVSIRIQVDNTKGSSWTDSYEVFVQIIVILPR